MFPPQKQAMGGPPPGTSPQGLSSLGPSLMSRETDDLDEANPAGGGAGGLKDVFDELQQVLDALAGILPDQAGEIDAIRQSLAEVLAKAISGGATFKGREGSGVSSPANPSLPM